MIIYITEQNSYWEYYFPIVNCDRVQCKSSVGIFCEQIAKLCYDSHFLVKKMKKKMLMQTIS